MSQVQIYSSAFKAWQNAESIGPVRVSSMVPDVNGNIIHTNDFLAVNIPDKTEPNGYIVETYIVFIAHGIFKLRNLLSGKVISLYEYRSGMRIVGNAIEGTKLKLIK